MKKYIINSKTHGKKIVLLDDEDYDYFVNNNIKLWINYAPTVHNFYVIFCKDNKRVRLHRFITKCPKGLQVDHVNHNTLDNRKENLRVVTLFQNQQNRVDNKSGKVGVYWNARDKVYVASIGKKWLVQSKDINEAIDMRIRAEIQKAKG